MKKTKDNKFWWGYDEKGTLVYCWWECISMVQINLEISQKLNTAITWFMYPTTVFICTLKWNQSKKHLHCNVYCTIIPNSPRSGSSQNVHQLMNKKENVVHIESGIFCHRNNEILSFVTPWREMDIIMLSEMSQARKKTSITWSHSCMESSKVDLLGIRSRMVFSRGWGK